MEAKISPSLSLSPSLPPSLSLSLSLSHSQFLLLSLSLHALARATQERPYEMQKCFEKKKLERSFAVTCRVDQRFGQA